jgi:hypothetical protein
MKLFKDHKPELLIALIGIVTYIISLANTFHTDDWLVLNLMRDGFSWRDFLSMENMGRFRPLTNIFVFLRYLAFGDSPFDYYAVNIILHAFCAVLLYRFLLKVGLKAAIAFLSALIFAAYFQHYEAVLWLYGTIRILGAIFWIACLWALYDYLITAKKSSLLAFSVFSFLGYFIVEDFVASPLGFLAFALFVFGNTNREEASVSASFRRIWKPWAISIIGLGIYFALRSTLIINPGVVEDYYYLGPHIFARLAAYLEWMILPPPDHSYFQGFASHLSPAFQMIWKGMSLASIAGLLVVAAYVFIKSRGVVRFLVIFIIIALLPALPLNYKVTSRNIYIPSIGLSVLFGYFFYMIYERLKNRNWLRILMYLFLTGYLLINIMGAWVASHEYRKTQTMVASLIDDFKTSGLDLNKYNFVLLDHLPGRTVVGPAMIYKLKFNHEVIASNDPSVPVPSDIHAVARDFSSRNIPFVVFDYRDGHLRESTADYLK